MANGIAGGYGYGNTYAIVLVLFILLAIIGCVCYSGFSCC
ncbi:YjcZ family sporulation protein [Mycoplasmatota bacterium]|nr:YjcZ family sporulation protein [Mycoplasmatota bacterium]